MRIILYLTCALSYYNVALSQEVEDTKYEKLSKHIDELNEKLNKIENNVITLDDKYITLNILTTGFKVKITQLGESVKEQNKSVDGVKNDVIEEVNVLLENMGDDISNKFVKKSILDERMEKLESDTKHSYKEFSDNLENKIKDISYGYEELKNMKENLKDFKKELNNFKTHVDDYNLPRIVNEFNELKEKISVIPSPDKELFEEFTDLKTFVKILNYSIASTIQEYDEDHNELVLYNKKIEETLNKKLPILM